MRSPDALDSDVLKALSHPLRMRMLTFINEHGEASPVEMSRALDHPLATVSHHARVLRDLGCIELARTEPRRGAVEHYYRAVAAPFIDDEHWASLSAPVRRRVAGELLRHVFSDAAAAGQSGGFDGAGAHIARLLLDLDADGRRELSEAVLALLQEAQAIQDRSDARRGADASADAEPSELAVLHFASPRPPASPRPRRMA
jgi:DNA-binding transcriptional ArsR family regulator